MTTRRSGAGKGTAPTRGTRTRTGKKAAAPESVPVPQAFPADQEQALSHALLDSLPGIYYMYGTDMVLRRWNRNFERVTGYSGEELQHMSPLDFFAGPDRERVAERIRAVFRDGFADVEADFLSRDGTRTPYYFTGARARIQGRSYLLGVGFDLTDLRESEHRYELANRATFNAIWDWDLRTDAVWWNTNFQGLFGYRAEEIEPGIESWTRRIHPDDLERVAAGIHAAIDTGLETWRDEYRFRRGDGTYADVEDRGYITHDAQGRPARMLGAMQDITERKQAAETLRKNEEHLRIAMDAAQMAAFDWDLVSNTLTWRHTSSNWFGVAPGTIQDSAERFLAMVHADDRESNNEKIRHCIETQTSYSNELRMIWPDGSVHWVMSLASFEFDAQGKALRMRGIVMETTARKQAEDALKLFRTLVDRANDPIEVIDPATGRFLDVNDTFCRALGYTREEMLRMSVPDIDPTFARPTWPGKVAALRAAGSVVAEGWHRHKNGGLFPVEVSMAWVQLDRDYIVASARDISDRRQAEQSIRRLSRIHAVLSGINALIARERDQDGLFTAVCSIIVEKGQFACAWIGLSDDTGTRVLLRAMHGTGIAAAPAGTVIPVPTDGSNPRDILAGSMRTGRAAYANILTPEAVPHLAQLGLQGKNFRSAISLPLTTHDRCVGALVLFSAEAGQFDTGELALLRGLAGDISFALEYMESQQRVHHMAYHDALTGLANRSFLVARLRETVEQARNRGHSCALLLMNLNNFHSVNNSLGYQNGDILLRHVAERLRHTVWESDVVACLGGDEFAILLPRLANSDDVDVVVRKLDAGMRGIFTVADLPLSIELRIGYALFPEQADSADLLWQRASVALRTAKERHRPAVQYDRRYDHYDARNLALLSNLRAALDGDQLLLHYQPKIDLRTMKVTGAEALVRWQHPQLGLIYPDTFIPLAEQTTLISDLTMRVLALATKQGRAWMQQGHAFDMAINLSARNIHDAELCAHILELLRTSGFPVQHLILEITESAIMSDPEQGRSVLMRLADAGVRISMDDFGIGQSSLAYLKDLPISQVKIDKSFVMGMAEARNAAIVHAVIELAHGLDMLVTAEGIEDEAALARLRAWGCDNGQGYFFSRPLPADRFPAWLAQCPWK